MRPRVSTAGRPPYTHLVGGFRAGALMSHSHGPSAGSAATRAGARHVRPLAITFALVLTFMAVEFVAG